MEMPGFDISTLVQFSPASERCSLCLALWPADMDRRGKQFTCPGCEALYFASPVITSANTISLTTLGSNTGAGSNGLLWSPTYGPMYVEPSAGQTISLGAEPMAHAICLAKLANQLRHDGPDNPPLRVLMQLLQASRSFIHLTSFSFDQFTLAMLEMAAQATSIAAVLSGINPRDQEMLDKVPAEAPDLQLRVEGTKADPRDQNHGKLIVIDGLLAVVGSANMTRPAWRKAAANMEIVDVVTDLSRVTELNNRYFSPLWWRLHPDRQPRYHLPAWTILTAADPEHPNYEHKETLSAENG
jgi:PLD-like domain